MSDPNPTSPDTKGEATKPAKSKTKKSSAAGASENPPPLINPQWATAIIKKQDVIGKTAELAAKVLTAAIEKQVLKATQPEKLEKIVWSAITEARRQARG